MIFFVRYITFPGQACSYKIGALKIIDLRKKAVRTLKRSFDPREFHRAVLSCPASMKILEACIETWLKEKKSKQNILQNNHFAKFSHGPYFGH